MVSTSFFSCGFDKKLTQLPNGLAYFNGVLDLSHMSLGVDMIPAGLKGVHCVVSGLSEDSFPDFIAPDYMGKVKCEFPVGAFFEMNSQAIQEAKREYIKYRRFVESPRRSMGGLGPICVLPKNMSFYEKDGKTYLDLTKTTITEKPSILGVDEVIMPQKKLVRHRARQMVHSKPKIY